MSQARRQDLFRASLTLYISATMRLPMKFESTLGGSHLGHGILNHSTEKYAFCYRLRAACCSDHAGVFLAQGQPAIQQ
jgi:hypothetical protein